MGLTSFQFFGCRTPAPQRVHSVKDMNEAATVLATVGPGIDICEFCGGEARTSAVAIRRHLSAGRNFDLVTHTDLGDPGEQRATMKYLNENEVQVLVMAPSCRTLGPPSNVNYQINHETWCEHYEEDAPHVRFCGDAALHQIKKKRHFLAENHIPHGCPTKNHGQSSARIAWYAL